MGAEVYDAGRYGRAVGDYDSLYPGTGSETDAAIELIANLSAIPIPDTLLSNYLPAQYVRVRNGKLNRNPEALIVDKIRDVLRVYSAACRV